MSAAVSAKAIHAHHRSAAIAAVTGTCITLGLGSSSGGSAVLLLISYTLISGGIFLISRFHLICPLEAAGCFSKPAAAVIYASFKEVPFRIAVIFRNTIKKFIRFRNAVLLDKPSNVRKLAVRGISASVIIIACVSGSVSSVIVSGVSVRGFSGFAVLLYLVIGGVDIFHFFRGNIRKGVINVFIRMIFSNKIAVCFFDFLIGGSFRNAEDFIRILRLFLPLFYL